MGKRGPAKRPTVMSLKLNDPGHRAKQDLKRELRPPSDKIKPPSFLDSSGLKKWKQIMDEHESMEVFGQKLVTNIDVDALAVYCQTWSDYLSYCKIIKKEGNWITTFTEDRLPKEKKKNPFIELRMKTANAIIKIGNEFGFTPSSRTRIEATPGKTKEVNKLESFMQPVEKKKTNEVKHPVKIKEVV